MYKFKVQCGSKGVKTATDTVQAWTLLGAIYLLEPGAIPTRNTTTVWYYNITVAIERGLQSRRQQ